MSDEYCDEQDDESGWDAYETPSIKRPMPSDLRTAWTELQDDVIRLHFVWHDFSTLFRNREARELIAEAAGGFFQIAGWVYWQDMVIELHKLIDEPEGRKLKGGGRAQNLTLTRFVTEGHVDDDALRDRIADLLEKCREELKGLSLQRNRRVAHNDLPTRLGISPDLSELHVDYRNVDRALKYIRRIMNAIGHYYDDSEVGYDSRVDKNDASLLLSRLRDALRWVEQAGGAQET